MSAQPGGNPRTNKFSYYARRLGFVFRLGTSPWRALPDFVIVGAQKAGTTFLFKYLAQHPQILPAVRKEVRFFDLKYQAGEYWYRSHFPLRVSMSVRSRLSSRCITGESSPYYLFHPQIPKRVQAMIPQVKLIALLRDPVDRAISGYYEAVNTGHETLPLKEALAAEEQRIEGEAERLSTDAYYTSSLHFKFSYKARGVYLPQIHRWHACFPPEQLLVLKSEELFASGKDTWSRICDFLGVDEWMPARVGRVNALIYSAPDEAVRAQLQAYFRPHNRRLFEYLGVEWDWGY